MGNRSATIVIAAWEKDLDRAQAHRVLSLSPGSIVDFAATPESVPA